MKTIICPAVGKGGFAPDIIRRKVFGENEYDARKGLPLMI